MELLGLVNRTESQQALLKIAILAISCIVSFSLRLFAVIRFESVIHEVRHF